MSSKKSIYFSDEIEKIIDIDPNTSPESFSGRIGFLVSGADKMAREQCPALPVDVWCALADANNGTWHNYELGCEFVVSGVSINLFDSISQFDVDPQEWGAKIRKMSFAQQFAIFEVIRRFWMDKETVNSAANYTDAFKKLGANILED